MDKGETIMPVPQGIISTSTGPVDPETLEVVQEVVQDLVEEELPEAEVDES
jgi:carbamoylphosphate synthase small subunit